MAVIIRRSANPNFGDTNTSIDNAVITMPNIMEEKSNDSSSFFFKPEIILTIPFASKPNPRKRISHFVANWGKKKPEPIYIIIPTPTPMLSKRDDLLTPLARTPLAILSAPSIIKAIPAKNSQM